jgi:hypothetical protein
MGAYELTTLDCNQNGEPDEFEPWLCDITQDGYVDIQDVFEVFVHWGDCVKRSDTCPGDVDCDWWVGRSDLARVFAAWGPMPSASQSRRDLGGVTHSIVEIDNSEGDSDNGFGAGTTHFTFDIQVTVTDIDDGEDYWTTGLSDAVLTDQRVTFYRHPLGSFDGLPPHPDLFQYFPALEFECYWTGATEIGPGESGSLETMLAPWPFDYTENQMTAIWCNPISDPLPPGTYTIARVTVEAAEPCDPCVSIVPAGDGGDAPILGTIIGSSTHHDGYAMEIPFAFDIIEVPGADCPADINGDGFVNVDDLFLLLNAWGPCDGCPEDITDDGLVNVDDLFAVINHWGPCP